MSAPLPGHGTSLLAVRDIRRRGPPADPGRTRVRSPETSNLLFPSSLGPTSNADRAKRFGMPLTGKEEGPGPTIPLPHRSLRREGLRSPEKPLPGHVRGIGHRAPCADTPATPREGPVPLRSSEWQVRLGGFEPAQPSAIRFGVRGVPSTTKTPVATGGPGMAGFIRPGIGHSTDFLGASELAQAHSPQSGAEQGFFEGGLARHAQHPCRRCASF